MVLEQGEVVLCTVDRIIGTTVFVKIDSENSVEGTIITSEIAPGRIRNLRDYVVPKKKIVCKILRISDKGNIELSLRRVTQKETKEVMEQFKLEKSYEHILKSVLGESSEKIIEKIKSEAKLFDFIESAKTNPKNLEKIAGKENTKKILDILGEQKEKVSYAKKEITLTTAAPNGLEQIKKILSGAEKKGIEVKYISAGKYSLAISSNDLKKSDNELKLYAEELEKYAKENNLNFAVKDK